jgi:hypothetical protein
MKSVIALAALFGGVFFLAGAVIIGLQTLAYFYHGSWVPFSLIEFSLLFSSSPWLVEPHEWIGVHNILSKIPASLTLIGVGILIWSSDDPEDYQTPDY